MLKTMTDKVNFEMICFLYGSTLSFNALLKMRVFSTMTITEGWREYLIKGKLLFEIGFKVH